MNRNSIGISHILLLPFSLLYRLIVSLRNLLFNFKILPSTEFDIPIISVGNISVGGTGKTPHIEYLAELLMHENFTPAILSRGYKRKTSDFQIATGKSTVSQIGDEPKQLKTRFPDLIVATDRKRVNGIYELLKMQQTPDLVLLDDAFQHRYVKPGLSIVLMEYNRLITDDFLLPAGRLREAPSSLKRADIVLLTKTPENITQNDIQGIAKKLRIGKHQQLFATSIVYEEIRPVYDTAIPKTIEQIKQHASSILLLTGIANPKPLHTFAKQISPEIRELKYPDHYAYTSSDLEKIREALSSMPGNDPIILTTEKDAMRLMELNPGKDLQLKMYYVPIKVTFVENLNEVFDPIIIDYVRNNTRNTELHTKPD